MAFLGKNLKNIFSSFWSTSPQRPNPTQVYQQKWARFLTAPRIMETHPPRSLPHVLRLSNTLETYLWCNNLVGKGERDTFLNSTSLPNKHQLLFRNLRSELCRLNWLIQSSEQKFFLCNKTKQSCIWPHFALDRWWLLKEQCQVLDACADLGKFYWQKCHLSSLLLLCYL